jgi:hypothetical protein
VHLLFNLIRARKKAKTGKISSISGEDAKARRWMNQVNNQEIAGRGKPIAHLMCGSLKGSLSKSSTAFQ